MANSNFGGENQRFASADSIGTVLECSKPPWRPIAAGYSAFFLGPMAGALVAAASLRRMGESRRAQKTVMYTLLALVAFLIPFLLAIPPDAGIKRIILIAVEGAGYSVFPSLLREDYMKWKRAHPGVNPSSGWAAAGWGILGALIYLGLSGLILAFWHGLV